MKTKPTASVTCSGCQWKGVITDCHWTNIEATDDSSFLTADILCPKCDKKLEKK